MAPFRVGSGPCLDGRGSDGIAVERRGRVAAVALGCGAYLGVASTVALIAGRSRQSLMTEGSAGASDVFDPLALANAGVDDTRDDRALRAEFDRRV